MEGSNVARRREHGTGAEYGGMGDRLRAARQAQGVSLRSLADRLGVSPSLISQVETGRANPSVSTLYAIVNALGISLDELLFTDAWATADRVRPAAVRLAAKGRARQVSAPEDGIEIELPSYPVQRAGSRSAIRLASGVTWERLTTASIPNVDFLYVTYEVGGASSPEDEFQRHTGQEWGYVLSGRLGVRIGFEEFVLGPGDAIAFDSGTPHRLFNAGEEPVHGVWFVLGRQPVELGTTPAGGQGEAGPPVHSH